VRASVLRLYHALPYPLRCLAASARGWRLSSWRYGRETDRLVEGALERETWSANQWSVWREERLDHILQRAVNRIPFYREYWEKQKAESKKQKPTIGVQPKDDVARGGWQELQNWPVLKKAELRSRPELFVAEDCDRRRMFCEHTSGTTGTPLALWKSRDTVRQWYALFEARWRRWYGLSRHDRWAILGGQLVTPFAQKQPPFWVWNAVGHQLYLSTYHITPRNAAAYVEALKQHRVTYLWTYSSAAHALAHFVLEQNLQPPELKAVITNAEPLYQQQRETIAQAFNCRVFETYGMCEMPCAASECLHGGLHLWPEAGVSEVLRDDADGPVEPGETGRLVCTGLINQDMPLVRYEVGDRAALAPVGQSCSCGRSLPLLLTVQGRSDDVIITPDGRRIGRLDPVFKAGWPIREAQVIQESLAVIRVRLVPSGGFNDAIQDAVSLELRARLGNMKIEFEKLAEIPRGSNGKFRSVICNLSAAEKEHLQLQAISGQDRALS
jgi:phenylacetate-CoA ligase